MNELITLLQQSPEIVKEAYKDLVQPSARKVGEALSTVADFSNTILLPLKLVNAKSKLLFKKRLEDYAKKLENIDEKNIIDVPPELGLPILEKFTYTTNDEIANLFINLLAKASSKETINEAHPSFIQLIERLSVDEARILSFLSGKSNIPFVRLIGDLKNPEGFNYLTGYTTNLENEVEVDFPNNMKVYLDNLVSIRIIDFPERPLHLVGEDPYLPILKKLEPMKKNIEENAPDYFKSIRFEKGYYQITNYGMAFINACTGK